MEPYGQARAYTPNKPFGRLGASAGYPPSGDIQYFNFRYGEMAYLKKGHVTFFK
jgi:hypothetical protein